MTQELIVSIASNYPAGSLLRIRNTHDLFACREFQGAPPLNSHSPTFLVLDGQQRLTSLYQAFYGVGDHLYYLNIRQLLEGNDFEECIFHLRANVKQAREYGDPDVQAQELVLPLSVLNKGAGEFFGWILHVMNKAPESERTRLVDDLQTIRARWIQAIDDYRFPVVTLSDETGADAVCTIFETLNRTGVKLSPFELLTARFWPKNVNLRRLWANVQDEYPIISDFMIDPYYLLQIVSLAARRAPSCKRSDVLDLEVNAIEEWWDRAVWGLAQGLEILRDDCGVIIPKWLPYNTIVIPLAAVLAKCDKFRGLDVGVARTKLARWFWCSVFGQTYERASNSQAARDATELFSWLKGGGDPETVQRFQFDPQILRDITPRQLALYRGTVCLVLRHGSRDFHSGAKLTGDLIVEHRVDDHHIFPQAYLERQGITARPRDCVLNRTLIDRETNIRIRDRAPAKYMEEIRSAFGPEKFLELLQSHLLPGDLDSPVWSNDFETFLSWRQDIFWKEIQNVTGVAQATEVRIDAMPLPESSIEELVPSKDEEISEGQKDTLWPLPGGKNRYFETLLAFLDEIGAHRPTFDEINRWVFAHYPRTTRDTYVKSVLRATLRSMGLIDFNGELVVLTPEGESLCQSRDHATLLALLKKNIRGVTEVFEFLKERSADTEAIYEYLVETLKLFSWQTDAQVIHRLDWLAACGAVEQAGTIWRRTGQID